jgi:hypothetical protein
MGSPRTGGGAIETTGRDVVSIVPAAIDDEALADRLRVELQDLRAVVDLEVDHALFGITPSQYLQRVAELERRRAEPRWVHGRDKWGIGLPSLPYPPQRKPWTPVDLGESIHQPNRGGAADG